MTVSANIASGGLFSLMIYFENIMIKKTQNLLILKNLSDFIPFKDLVSYIVNPPLVIYLWFMVGGG